MLRAYINTILDVLDYEADKVREAQADGLNVIKPSAIIVLLFSFMYLSSPLDIIPERFLTGYKFIGYLDDFVLLILSSAYFYNALKEVVLRDEQDNIQLTGNSEDTDLDTESNVSNADRLDVQYSSDGNSSTSSMPDIREELENNIITPICGDNNFDDNSTNSDSEDAEDDEYGEESPVPKYKSKF